MNALSPGHGPLADLFVTGIGPSAKNAPPPVPFSTDSQITWRQRWDHWQARWGYRRGDHRVPPGLYALGEPDHSSPVLVTANYTLSFDAVRAALAGHSCYLLVLDTKGVNVWCAAGIVASGSSLGPCVLPIYRHFFHSARPHRACGG